MVRWRCLPRRWCAHWNSSMPACGTSSVTRPYFTGGRRLCFSQSFPEPARGFGHCPPCPALYSRARHRWSSITSGVNSFGSSGARLMVAVSDICTAEGAQLTSSSPHSSRSSSPTSSKPEASPRDGCGGRLLAFRLAETARELIAADSHHSSGSHADSSGTGACMSCMS